MSQPTSQGQWDMCTHIEGGLQFEGCGSLSHIQNVVKKIGEDNWKVGTISQFISQMLALGLKHDKIWA